MRDDKNTVMLLGKAVRKVLRPTDKHFDATVEINITRGLPADKMILRDKVYFGEDVDFEVIIHATLFNNIDVGQNVEFVFERLKDEEGGSTLNLTHYCFIA